MRVGANGEQQLGETKGETGDGDALKRMFWTFCGKLSQIIQDYVCILLYGIVCFYARESFLIFLPRPSKLPRKTE